MAAVSEGAETEILAFVGKVLDAYEDRVRASAELQLTVARALHFEPARSLAATYMDVTRDIVAAQVSSARWLFDV